MCILPFCSGRFLGDIVLSEQVVQQQELLLQGKQTSRHTLVGWLHTRVLLADCTARRPERSVMTRQTGGSHLGMGTLAAAELEDVQTKVLLVAQARGWPHCEDEGLPGERGGTVTNSALDALWEVVVYRHHGGHKQRYIGNFAFRLGL